MSTGKNGVIPAPARGGSAFGGKAGIQITGVGAESYSARREAQITGVVAESYSARNKAVGRIKNPPLLTLLIISILIATAATAYAVTEFVCTIEENRKVIGKDNFSEYGLYEDALCDIYQYPRLLIQKVHRIIVQKGMLTSFSFVKEDMINGRVYAELYVGQDREFLLPPKILLMKQLSLPYLITSLKGMNEETTHNKYYTDNTKRKSQSKREFFKEIACQSYCKDSYSQIEYCTGNKFSASFVTIFHIYKDNIDYLICQGNFGSDFPFGRILAKYLNKSDNFLSGCGIVGVERLEVSGFRFSRQPHTANRTPKSGG